MERIVKFIFDKVLGPTPANVDEGKKKKFEKYAE
jgi:hypothetical protein